MLFESKAWLRESLKERGVEIDRLEEARGTLRMELQLERDRLRTALETLSGVERGQVFLKELVDLKLPEAEVGYVLGSIADDDRQYLALMKVIEAQMETEQSNAFVPGLDDGDAHYNRGRAAAVADMLSMIEQMRQRGRELIARNGKEG